MIDTKSEKYELPLIRFSIVSCNSTFHPDEISSNEYLRQVLRTIYMDLKESKDRWKAVMANICDSLENVSRSVSTDLKGERKVDFKGKLFFWYYQRIDKRRFLPIFGLKYSIKKTKTPTSIEIDFLLGTEHIKTYWLVYLV